MNRQFRRRTNRFGLITVGLLWGTTAHGNAAVYAQNGVRGDAVTVCFVGDALVSRPDRVQQAMDHLKQYEYAANVDFQLIGTCPPPAKQQNGNDFYGGDIRVVLPATSVSGTGLVPGKGCTYFLQNGVYNGNNDTW